VNGDDLWPGLIDERLDFRLLVRCEIERLGQMRQCESVTVQAAVKVSRPSESVLGLGKSVTGERDGAGGRKCKQVQFCFHLNDFRFHNS
jgi:hypothetical protein